MRALVALAIITAATACNGDKDGTSQPTDSGTSDQPIVFELKSSTTATSFEAGVVPLALQAHQVSSMLVASTALVVADEKVQDRLNTDGGGDLRRAAPLRCWNRPDYPMFSFTLDYTGCAGYGISGGVFVNDHPAGPLLFDFNNLAFQPDGQVREIGGVLGLDTIGAYPEPLYWQTYDTDQTEPGPDNRIPVTVSLDGQRFGVSYSGGAAVDFLGQTWSMWGVATITGLNDESLTVVQGARLPEEVAPDEPTGDDVLKSPLNWLECRCPTSGLEALDMPLHFEQVSIDIDDLEVEPDDVDDPVVDVPVDYELAGQGVLTHTGCGEYDVDYQSEAATIPVPLDQLVGSISFLCSTHVIDDERRCAALIAAAAGIGGDLQVAISPEEAQGIARSAVDSDFDTTWCQVY
ncbi:MAG: hypothetical protein R3F59_16300 [Myxococcota bacterium]